MSAARPRASSRTLEAMRRALASLTLADVALLALTFAAAFALKRHYAGAEAEDLRWVLAPTAHLVELLTGASFELERDIGFVDREHMFAIVPACAGINFLIVAFCSGVIGLIVPRKSAVEKFAIALGCAVVAYAATLAANTVRVALAFWLFEREITPFGLSADDVHRIQGIAVYFTALCVLFWAAHALTRGSSHDSKAD